jgi:hypothetical protein
MEAKKAKKICIVIILCAASSLIIPHFLWSWKESALQLNAVIIDQAALTSPNPPLIASIKNMVRNSGYETDHYQAEEVTVNLYRSLPKHNYRLIIIRTHSGVGVICTGEKYEETKYVSEQLTGQLERVFLSGGSYFAITTSFILTLNGRFKDSVVLMMGCAGLSSVSIAEAFISKGAKVYISWKQSVSTIYNDDATMILLTALLAEEKTIEQAVTETMTQMGSYPVLAYYPPEAGEMKVIASSGLASTFFLFGTTVSFMVGISNGYLVNYWCDDCKNTIINGSGEDPIFEDPNIEQCMPIIWGFIVVLWAIFFLGIYALKRKVRKT